MFCFDPLVLRDKVLKICLCFSWLDWKIIQGKQEIVIGWFHYIGLENVSVDCVVKTFYKNKTAEKGYTTFTK